MGAVREHPQHSSSDGTRHLPGERISEEMGPASQGGPVTCGAGTALPAGFQGLTRQLAHRQVKTPWALPCNQRPADAHAPKRSALNQRCLSSRLQVKKGGREGMGQHDKQSLCSIQGQVASGSQFSERNKISSHPR